MAVDLKWKRIKAKFRFDFKRENLPIIAPYLWMKHKKTEKGVLKISSPSKLQKVDMFILDLVHIPSLLNDTAAIMKGFTKSNGVLIYLVDSATNQIYVCPHLKDSTNENNRVSWNIRTGSTIPAYVALTKKTVLVNNMKGVEDFQAYDWKDMTVTGVLCVPIVISDGSCYGVIELYRRNGMMYNQEDTKKIIPISRLIATAVDNHLNRLSLQTRQILTKSLLYLTQYYFGKPDQLPHLLCDIVNLANDSLDSERGAFFFYDSNTHELIDDLHQPNSKFKEKIDKGIAGLALQTGKLINIRDLYNDSRFVRASDIKTGIITRSVLCIPVFGRSGILGVLQIVNKRHGFYEPVDEQIYQLFANYCSIAVEYTNLFKKQVIGHQSAELYSDCYFSQLLNIEIKQDIDFEIDAAGLPSDFYQYSFYPTTEDQLPKLACWIFRSLKIPDENYTNFICSVRRGYRNNYYHNFEHAFNALHSVFLTLERHPDKFDYLEKVSFLISAVCHDIDHRGVSNNFLEIIESPLVVLYDQSPMENHHVFLTMILLEQSCFKQKFDKMEFKMLTTYITEMILATDLTRYLEEVPNISSLCEDIPKSGGNIWIDNRRRVRNLLMTSADLSGMAKPFENAKIIVKHLMQEFYEEGEQIKALGMHPLPIMDIKNIEKIPEIQIQFLEVITIPCFEVLATLLPKTFELLENARTLLTTWKELIIVRDALE